MFFSKLIQSFVNWVILLYLFQCYTSPKLASIVLGVVPPVAALSVAYGRYLRVITKNVRDSLAESTNVRDLYTQFSIMILKFQTLGVKLYFHIDCGGIVK